MSSCPKCQQEIEADFGMVTCPSCEVVVFVGMDGEIKIHADNGSSQEVVEAPVEFTEKVTDEVIEEAESDQWSPEEGIELESEQNQQTLEDLTPVEGFSVQEPLETQEEIAEEEVLAVDESVEQSLENSDTDRFAEENQTEESFSDVVEFANSEVSQASEGVFVYSVTVEGIDTKEIRQDILDHLGDRRLSVSDQLQNINDGVLHLRDLNPVKASLIVNRLKSVDVKVHWIQYAITEVDIVDDFSSESSDSGGG